MSLTKNTHAIETFPRRVGSTDTMVGVNMHLEARAPVKNLEWVNSLRITLPGHDDAGSRPTIAAARIDLGDSFLSEDPGAPRLVGSISTARSAEWFIYSESPCAEQLERAITLQFPQLEVRAHAEHDPRWSVFRDFLMPSPLERHLIETRRIFQGLLSRRLREGDGVTLNHTIWFSDPMDREEFAETLNADEYFVHFPDIDESEDALFELPGAAAPPKTEAVEYGLLLSHYVRLSIERLDEVVQFIYRQATSFGGDYEGWYTPDDRGE